MPHIVMLNETKGFITKIFRKAYPEYRFQHIGGKVMIVCKKEYVIQLIMEELNDELFMLNSGLKRMLREKATASY